MKNLFKKQLGENSAVTEQVLKNIKIKTYKNGEEIKVGDKVLYALLTDMVEGEIKPIDWSVDVPMERDNFPHEIKLELITLNEFQFDLYTYDNRFQDTITKDGLPIIRLK
jgi:hypothetical protein